MSLVGYARGSTTEGSRVLDREFNAYRASGTTSDRPNLAACLDYLRRDDVLILLDLDRLGCLASGVQHLRRRVQRGRTRKLLIERVECGAAWV